MNRMNAHDFVVPSERRAFLVRSRSSIGPTRHHSPRIGEESGSTFVSLRTHSFIATPLKTNMDPENHWLVEENTLPGGQDVRVYVSFRECMFLLIHSLGTQILSWSTMRGHLTIIWT